MSCAIGIYYLICCFIFQHILKGVCRAVQEIDGRDSGTWCFFIVTLLGPDFLKCCSTLAKMEPELQHKVCNCQNCSAEMCLSGT